MQTMPQQGKRLDLVFCMTNKGDGELCTLIRRAARRDPKESEAAGRTCSRGRRLSSVKVSYSYKCITNFLSMRNKICNADLP